MRYEFTISNSNEIRVWDTENPNENGAPFLFQPDRPDGTPWANRAEAEEWVQNRIADLLAPPDPE